VAIDFDPCRPQEFADPYPFYRALRDEAPVHRSQSTGALCISRYDDVLTVLKDSETFSSSAMRTFLMNGGAASKPRFNGAAVRMLLGLIFRARINPFTIRTGRSLIAEDGAPHGEMRGIVNRGFTPRQVTRWESRARELVAESMQPLDHGRPFDLVRDLSVPLPVHLICEVLGIDGERHDDFKHWSNVLIDFAAGPGRDKPVQSEAVEAFLELSVYLSQIARQRKRVPGDDLVSTIVTSSAGKSGLSIQETVNFVTLLLVAGNETTTNLIGNAVDALLDHPDQLRLAANDPALVSGIIEETLRYDAPIQLLFREATRDTEIAGTPIAKGTFVAPLIGSANRDERRFEDPDRFDITRQAQGHLGFGFGAHFCLGASLARLEAGAALEPLVRRLEKLERTEPTERIDSFLIRGPRRLLLRPAA